MKNSLWFALLLCSQLSNAQQQITPAITTIEIQEEEVRYKPIKSYFKHGAGLGYQNKSGTLDSQGMYATYQLRGYHSERDGVMAFGSAGVTFNVINKDAGASHHSTELGFTGSGFVGHGFDSRNDGIEFFVGASGNLNVGSGKLSRYMGQNQWRVGPETGLAIRNSNVLITVAPSVGLGGDQCTIESNGQQLNVGTNGISFAGIGRVMVGNKFAMNVLYSNIPGSNGTANLSEGMVFWRIGKKVTLTGACSYNHITMNNGENVELQTFQAGLIQTFGIRHNR